MENNKTQAELYREERKERLAKAAAKKAKKSPAVEKTKKIVTKVIAIVLAVVIGLGAIYGVLDFFGTTEKVLKVSVDDTDYKFSLAEYNYYYYTLVMQYTQTAYQYDSYYGEGSGLTYLGYDYSKSPDKQEYSDDYASSSGYTLEDLGNPKEPTWADVFRCATIEQILQIKVGAAKAAEKGITLTEEEIKTIDDSIEEVRKSAKSKDYSLNRYLRATYGNGVDEKLVRQLTEEQTLSANYYTALQDEMLEAITSEQINTKYNENKNLYNIASLRIYSIAIEADVADDATEAEKTAAQEKATKEVKARAEAILSQITDEKSFISQAELDVKTNAPDTKNYDGDKATAANDVNYTALESASEDAAKWAYDSARKVGDKAVFETDDAYLVVLMVKLPHKDTTIASNDVRHILVQFPEKNTDGTATTTTDEEGNKTTNITKETKAETKAKAQAILDEYLKNPTEENFIALAKEKSEDTGSAEDGGLIEAVSDNRQYVEAFTNWAVNTARKPGDTGIVETEYGYHIMYYVKASEQVWYETVKSDIFNENFSAATDELINTYYEAVNKDSIFVEWTTKKQNKLIGTMILYNFS